MPSQIDKTSVPFSLECHWALTIIFFTVKREVMIAHNPALNVPPTAGAPTGGQTTMPTAGPTSTADATTMPSAGPSVPAAGLPSAGHSSFAPTAGLMPDDVSPVVVSPAATAASRGNFPAFITKAGGHVFSVLSATKVTASVKHVFNRAALALPTLGHGISFVSRGGSTAMPSSATDEDKHRLALQLLSASPLHVHGVSSEPTARYVRGTYERGVAGARPEPFCRNERNGRGTCRARA